ncbi:MAG: antibiotic biosynthesis monooxygenase [Pseudonocardia sp.]|nr:antibiotic biosynthesis monooxygenase [Pseudonocardia sp.]
MFIVRVAVRVLPEGREQVVAQLRKEEREVADRFAGCERFAVFSDPADPDSLMLYEEWASRQDAERYMASDYFEVASRVVFPLMNGAPDSAYYEAQRVGP